MRGIIYKYTSPGGKVYIGQTRNVRQRRNAFLNKNKSYGGKKIDNARNKYGANNFLFNVLCVVETENLNELMFLLNRLEKVHIKRYDSVQNGYNCNNGGGSMCGYKQSDETKSKISKANKGKAKTDEHKTKISISKTGVKLSDEHKFSITKALKDRRYTMNDKQKEAISKSKKGVENKKKFKQIVQLDLDNNVLNVFGSLKTAALFINGNYTAISKCINGHRKTAFGFKWQVNMTTLKNIGDVQKDQQVL